MLFSTDIITEAATFLDEFGEEITFTPQGSPAITIFAIVERYPPADGIQHGGVPFPGNRIELWIVNDTVIGRSEIKERFDKVKLKGRLDADGALVEYRITKIIDHDAGMWHLEAQA